MKEKDFEKSLRESTISELQPDASLDTINSLVQRFQAVDIEVPMKKEILDIGSFNQLRGSDISNVLQKITVTFLKSTFVFPEGTSGQDMKKTIGTFLANRVSYERDRRIVRQYFNDLKYEKGKAFKAKTRRIYYNMVDKQTEHDMMLALSPILKSHNKFIPTSLTNQCVIEADPTHIVEWVLDKETKGSPMVERDLTLLVDLGSKVKIDEAIFDRVYEVIIAAWHRCRSEKK